MAKQNPGFQPKFKPELVAYGLGYKENEIVNAFREGRCIIDFFPESTWRDKTDLYKWRDFFKKKDVPCAICVRLNGTAGNMYSLWKLDELTSSDYEAQRREDADGLRSQTED